MKINKKNFQAILKMRENSTLDQDKEKYEFGYRQFEYRAKQKT